MFLYTIIEAVAAVAIGLLLAIRTHRESYGYGAIDKFGIVTNVILLILYVCLAPFCMFIGMICYPAHDGVMGVLGWIVSFIIASSTLFSGLGLGASVALRKKGRSKLSFAVQFLGVLGIALALALFVAFYGNLLRTLN